MNPEQLDGFDQVFDQVCASSSEEQLKTLKNILEVHMPETADTTDTDRKPIWDDPEDIEFQKDYDEKMINMYRESNMTLVNIAEECGVSAGTIVYRLNKYRKLGMDIPRRRNKGFLRKVQSEIERDGFEGAVEALDLSEREIKTIYNNDLYDRPYHLVYLSSDALKEATPEGHALDYDSPKRNAIVREINKRRETTAKGWTYIAKKYNISIEAAMLLTIFARADHPEMRDFKTLHAFTDEEKEARKTVLTALYNAGVPYADIAAVSGYTYTCVHAIING